MGNTCLPFPRGSTASGLDTKILGPTGLVSTIPALTGLITGATPYRKDLGQARPVETKDHDIGNGGTVGSDDTITVPGFGGNLKLRLVQASAAITVSKLGLLIQFSTTAKHFGRVAHATYAAASGVPCKPIDNAYPIGTVIAKWDWFYVVEEGDCYICVLSGQTVTTGTPVAAHTSGQAGPGTAGKAVVGTAQQTVTADGTVATDYALVRVNAGFQDSDDAG